MWGDRSPWCFLAILNLQKKTAKINAKNVEDKKNDYRIKYAH